MTKAIFLDDTTIRVVASDGEAFILRTHLPVQRDAQEMFAGLIAKYFEENFSDDKTSMVHWVLMKMCKHNFTFYYESSNRSELRERIGSKIRSLREEKGIAAKDLAKLVNIDAANLSRIEQGRYSVGLDILSRIAFVLGCQVDIVPNQV